MKTPQPPGERAMVEAGFHAGPEHIDRDLQGYFDHYLQDPSACLALDAAAHIMMHEGRKQSDPGEITRMVKLPWWVLAEIGVGWMKYRRPLDKQNKPSLPEAFGISRKGKGKVPVDLILDREIKERKVALEVAFRMHEDPNIKEIEAILDVSDEFDIPESTVRDYWSRRRGDALEAIRLHFPES